MSHLLHLSSSSTQLEVRTSPKLYRRSDLEWELLPLAQLHMCCFIRPNSFTAGSNSLDFYLTWIILEPLIDSNLRTTISRITIQVDSVDSLRIDLPWEFW